MSLAKLAENMLYQETLAAYGEMRNKEEAY
jgi:hypothetical protein